MSIQDSLYFIASKLANTYTDAYSPAPTFTGGTHTVNYGQNTLTTYKMPFVGAAPYTAYYQTWDGYGAVALRGISSANNTADELTGGNSNDVLWGGGKLDRLNGGAGNDILISHAGTGSFGGSGNDVVVGGIEVRTNNPNNFLAEWRGKFMGYQSMSDAQLQSSFIITNENVNLAGDEGSDTLIATGGNDTLSGGSGNDYILAGDGDDQIYAGDPLNTSLDNDTVFGEGGNDYIYAAHGDDLVYGGTGDDTIHGDTDDTGLGANGPLVGNDTLFGEAGNDKMYGGAGNDYLDGGAGNDSMEGGAGHDTLLAGNEDTADSVNKLDGGDGDDLMAGGLGADQFIGGAGIDTVSYELSTMSVKASLANKDLNAYGALGDTFDTVENLVGSNYNDWLAGNGGANKLSGNAGDDYLNGGAGNDTLLGGMGEDSLYGEDGNDLLVGNNGYDFEFGGAGNDTFLFGIGSGYDHIVETANGGIDNLYLQGITDVGIYKQGNHLLIAASNDDVLVLDNWFVNQGVEYIDFDATQMRYLVSDLAGMAVEISSNKNMTRDANPFKQVELGTSSFATVDLEGITALGISPMDITILA